MGIVVWVHVTRGGAVHPLLTSQQEQANYTFCNKIIDSILVIIHIYYSIMYLSCFLQVVNQNIDGQILLISLYFFGK